MSSSSSSSSSSLINEGSKIIPFSFEEEYNNPVWCMASSGVQLFAGTGWTYPFQTTNLENSSSSDESSSSSSSSSLNYEDKGILLRSNNGSFWEEFYIVRDKNISAIHYYDSKLYIGTAPMGKLYISDLDTNETTYSQQIGGNIVSFVDYNEEIYVATSNPSNIYKYNSLTSRWDFFYKPYGNVYKMKVIGNFIYVIMDVNQVIRYDGNNMALVKIREADAFSSSSESFESSSSSISL